MWEAHSFLMMFQTLFKHHTPNTDKLPPGSFFVEKDIESNKDFCYIVITGLKQSHSNKRV